RAVHGDVGAGTAPCIEHAPCDSERHRGVTLNSTLTSRSDAVGYVENTDGRFRRSCSHSGADKGGAMTHGVVPRPGERYPLVGRAEELASVELALEGLDSGEPRAIELVGEPGIGKTRLLGELANRSDARGHLVLWGSASELERELPFSVFVHALDDYVGSLDPTQLRTVESDVQAELAHVFPSLSTLGQGYEVALQHERYRSHRAVRALLEQLAEAQPLVLVL